MEKNFNPMLLLQTLTSSLIICLVGLQVSNVSRLKIEKADKLIIKVCDFLLPDVATTHKIGQIFFLFNYGAFPTAAFLLSRG